MLVQNMSFSYLQRRGELVTTALAYARNLNLKDEVAHDAMLLMDRTMSTSLQVRKPADLIFVAQPCKTLLVLTLRSSTFLSSGAWKISIFCIFSSARVHFLYVSYLSFCPLLHSPRGLAASASGLLGSKMPACT